MKSVSLRNLGMLLLLLGWMTGCATARVPAKSGRIHHVVVCWLKEPGNPAQRARLIEGSRALAGIPSVESVSAGPCLTGRDARPMVDSTFDVAIVMTFRNLSDLASYLADPRHVKAAAEVLKPLAARVVIYDFKD